MAHRTTSFVSIQIYFFTFEGLRRVQGLAHVLVKTIPDRQTTRASLFLVWTGTLLLTHIVGRGAPEIDILEAQKNQVTGVGGKVSQSVQFAPFTHDYDYNTNTTADFEIFDETITQPNGYQGSAVQQAISGLTDLPSDIFNGSGGKFYTFGFEYWADPNNPDDAYITWQANGGQTLKIGPGAVSPDPLPNGSGVGQRLIAQEPMVSVLPQEIYEN